MERAYIALGSNLDQPLQQLQSALVHLKKLSGVKFVAVSKFYQTKPIGPQGQPDYINAVAAFDTTLTAHELLHSLQAIEHQHGRIRDTVRWGARTLDLDLILYGDHVISTPCLIVPHPGLKERNFVLYPLADLDKNIVLPDKTVLKNLLKTCSRDGIIELTDGETEHGSPLS